MQRKLISRRMGFYISASWALFALGLSEIILLFTQNGVYSLLCIVLTSCLLIIQLELLCPLTLRQVLVKLFFYSLLLVFFNVAYYCLVLITFQPGLIVMTLGSIFLSYPVSMSLWYVLHYKLSNDR